MNVVDIKFVGGDEILAELVGETEDTVSIKFGVYVARNPTNQDEVTLAPYMQFSEIEAKLDIEKKHILNMGTPIPSLVKMMKNKFYPSAIVTPNDDIVTSSNVSQLILE